MSGVIAGERSVNLQPTSIEVHHPTTTPVVSTSRHDLDVGCPFTLEKNFSRAHCVSEMPPFSMRPPIPAKLIRWAAALLESGLLVVLGSIALDGAVQDPESDGPSRLPLRLGFRLIPIVVVALAYAVQRLVKPRRFAFLFAGAIVSALAMAIREGLEPLQRLLDALRGFAVGAILTGLMMSIDDETMSLEENPVQPWRELFLATLLVTFGAMPSAIWGGFVLALPTILVGLVVLVRCIRYDARVVVPQRSAGAAFRVFLALLFVMLALGFLVVCPMISLGMMRMR